MQEKVLLTDSIQCKWNILTYYQPSIIAKYKFQASESFFGNRYTEEVSMNDDVLFQANNNFAPTKVTNVSSLMMQGRHYYYYYAHFAMCSKAFSHKDGTFMFAL